MSEICTYGGGQYGEPEPPYGECLTSPAPPPPPTPTGITADIVVVAEDIIKLTFSEELAVEQFLLSKYSYSIDSLGDAYPVVVKQVLVPEGPTTLNLFLQVSKLAPGGTYKITVSATLYQKSGIPVAPYAKVWNHHRTKVDAVIAGLADLFDTRERSNLRGLLEAIMISDELIGGDY